jgi:hypothetical protein
VRFCDLNYTTQRNSKRLSSCLSAAGGSLSDKVRCSDSGATGERRRTSTSNTFSTFLPLVTRHFPSSQCTLRSYLRARRSPDPVGALSPLFPSPPVICYLIAVIPPPPFPHYPTSCLPSSLFLSYNISYGDIFPEPCLRWYDSSSGGFHSLPSLWCLGGHE